MQSTELHYFLFTDKETETVLAMKPSRGFDFSLNLSEVNTVKISTQVAIAALKPFSGTYNFRQGFREAPIAADARLTLLKRKIDVLLLLKANVNLMRLEIKRSFSPKALKNIPVSNENFRKLWLFMRKERRIALRKVADFYRGIETEIDRAEAVQEVDEIYRNLNENVNLGVYSATNQERKNLTL